MDENETNFDETEDVLEELESTETEEVVEEQEPKAEKPKETPEAKKTRLERELKQLNKKLGIETPKEQKAEPKQNTGGLDENALDFLDLKGITDDDEIEIIEKVIAKTGQTVRQALKDDYVTSKLESLRQKKALQEATPSGTRRSGGTQVDTFATALAKYERTGELPTDFELKSKVINAKVEAENTNKPAWH